MATGPEHYKRADDMMQSLAQAADEGAYLPAAALTTMLAQAHVHATLALAAATAMSARPAGCMDELDFEAWDAVAGVQEEDDDPDGELAQWQRYDVSDVMQTVEYHTAPAPGDVVADEDGGPF